jgi:DNA-binding response OmpR family regulator
MKLPVDDTGKSRGVKTLRILIMEDDAALGTFLSRGLALDKHRVEVAADGCLGLRMALDNAFDLIVLDLSLPQMDGMEVLRELRDRCVDVSILVLTGRSTVSDRVDCLDLGADDFLPKPFSVSELTARCRALLRRRERFADPMLRQGDLELHRMERRVLRGGRTVELTVKEFALLEYLMLARGRTCSRGELLKEVWQMSPDAGTNVVDVYVNYLRKKLSAQQPAGLSGPGMEVAPDRIIDTVRGEGYSLSSAPVALAEFGARRPVRGVTPATAQGTAAGPGMGTTRVAENRRAAAPHPAAAMRKAIA